MPSSRIGIETLSLNTFNMSAAGFRRSLALCILVAVLCDGGKPKHTKPDIKIVFNRENATFDFTHRIYRVNVTCTVKTDNQISKISLGYIGPHHSRVKVLDKETIPTETAGDRYLMVEHQFMRVPYQGYIRCAARGDGDTHEVTERIIGYHTGCPKDVKIELTQDKLVRRPSGMTNISAEITGISRDNIQHFLFLQEHSHSVLYEFSVTPNVDNIKDTSLIVHRVHTPVDEGFKYTFMMNLTLLRFYSVEVQIDFSDAHCRQSIAVAFEDPKIILSLNDITKRNGLTDIGCFINEAAGQPFFTIGYEGTGSRNFTELTHDRSVQDLEDRYRGSYTAVVRVPGSGVITCEVRDGSGSYKTRRPIHIIRVITDSKLNSSQVGSNSQLTSSQNGSNSNKSVLVIVLLNALMWLTFGSDLTWCADESRECREEHRRKSVVETRLGGTSKEKRHGKPSERHGVRVLWYSQMTIFSKLIGQYLFRCFQRKRVLERDVKGSIMKRDCQPDINI